MANVITHAEGDSAEKLQASGRSYCEFLRRRAPLAGEGIWVSEDDFKGYADAVNAFWSNLARRFEKIR